MTVVHVVLPAGVDDVTRRSGGNVYDRRVCDGLRAQGWQVQEHEVGGAWPTPGAAVRGRVARALRALDDRSVVVVDGLVASGATDELITQASRLRVVVLVHLPAGVGATSAGVAARECALLRSAAAVVTTSAWTRDWLLAAYQLDGGRVHVAEPGVDEAALAPGTSTGGELVCVAAVARHKGQDVLIEALTRLVGLPWRCVCVGSTSRDPELTAQLVAVAESAGVSERFVLFGNRWGADLDAAYASADVLVLPSRVETYGLVVTEALAHGLPVIASDVGGLPDAMGDDGAGNRPGLLVPPADVDALAGALRRWLVDQDLRSDLRRAAAARRLTLRPWSATAEAFSRTLEQL